MVSAFMAIAFLFLMSFIWIVENRVLRSLRESSQAQARCLAEAGLAQALAAYPETDESELVNWANGVYSYKVKKLDGNQIEVISWGSRHANHLRLPAVELTTQWKIVTEQDQTRFVSLSRQERIVPSKKE